VADLPSEFWGGWIVAITVVSFISLLWLIIDVYRGGPDGNEHLVWDETLREGARPAPIWWFWFILALMTISVVYVMLYPGLGTYRGALGWSMGGRIEERFVDYEGQFGTQRKLIRGLPLAEIANSNSAMRSAWHVFNNNCSSCHGHDAAAVADVPGPHRHGLNGVPTNRGSSRRFIRPPGRQPGGPRLTASRASSSCGPRARPLARRAGVC
jgi:cytochrome c oxidase cbb3-type subunit 3